MKHLTSQPQVGVGVMIVKDGQVLLGKRKNSHGAGEWSFPGGHLEFKEGWEECAEREVAEETGLTIQNLRYGYATNNIFEKENKHYVTIVMLADYAGGEPQLKEPEKCEGWEWFAWDALPSPLFSTIRIMREQGYNIEKSS